MSRRRRNLNGHAVYRKQKPAHDETQYRILNPRTQQCKSRIMILSSGFRIARAACRYSNCSQSPLEANIWYRCPKNYIYAQRFISQKSPENQRLSPKSRRLLGEKTSYYAASIAVAMFAVSFAAVPLYRIYCQVTGKPGQAVKEESNKVASMDKVKNRPITVRFDANTHSSMQWNFKPVQEKVIVNPGETALAFYRATNPLDELVIGVATYTILPYEAGQYFNKIQCFCFEEQMLKPHEDVFMPVLFYVDPEFCKDPQLAGTNELVLSYTFFRSKDGEYLGLDEPIELKSH